MCLVHVDVNIVASGCMAFARPSSAAVLGFSCIKLHTTDLEQVVQEDHNSRAQKRKGQANQNHTAHKPTRTYRD